MANHRMLAAALPILLAGAGVVRADVFDTATDPDDFFHASCPDLVHGYVAVRDMPVRTATQSCNTGTCEDEDWYRLDLQPFSSYEIFVEGLSPDHEDPTGMVRLFDTATLPSAGIAGTPEAVSADYPDSTNETQSLRVEHPFAISVLRAVQLNGCGTLCTADDQYRIRAYETTIAVPRYNSAGSQVTVLIVQNSGPDAATGNVFLFDAAGTVVTSFPFTIPVRGALVQNLNAVNGGAAAGTSGTVVITNTAHYGDLAVKTVALEPATGFSFDSPGSYKPY